MYRYKILIVDDDKLLQNSLRAILSEKYEPYIAGSGEDAIRLLRKQPVDLVLLDIRLPGMDGIETLRQIKAFGRDLLVIMMTAYEDIKTVITSMKLGGYDYLVKPLEIEMLEMVIEKALESLRLKKEVDELRQTYRKKFNIENIVGESEGFKRVLEFADKVARGYDTTVLIEGESGVGKEVIARMIHYRSARFDKPFVGINCGAISKELLESELFGYDRGTFTGGLQEGKQGKIEMADSGTLLLDEVSELHPAAQVNCSVFWRSGIFSPWAAFRGKRSMFGSSPPPTRIWPPRCRPGPFGKTSFIGSMLPGWSFRPFWKGRRTSSRSLCSSCRNSTKSSAALFAALLPRRGRC